MRDEYFDRLVEFLQDRGYEVRVEKYDFVPHSLALFAGHGVRGAFGEAGYPWRYCNGRLSADNAGCFNKAVDCPLIVALPRSDSEREALLGHFRFLRSNAGYEWSNSFAFEDNPILPRDPLRWH